MASFNWPPLPSSGGSGVTSLNSLTGALSILAGTNITVTPSGSGITIASTASVTPGGSSGQVQFNNSGSFGGFGSWNGSKLALTGNLSVSGKTGLGISVPAYAVDIFDSATTGFDIGNSTTSGWSISNIGTISISNPTELAYLQLNGYAYNGTAEGNSWAFFLGNNQTGNIQCFMGPAGGIGDSGTNFFRLFSQGNVPVIGGVNGNNTINEPLSINPYSPTYLGSVSDDGSGQQVQTTTLSTQNIIAGVVNPNTSLSIINGTGGGQYVYAMPFQGASYKKFMISLQGLSDNGQTFNFPVAFVFQPTIYGDVLAIASINNTTTSSIVFNPTSGVSGNVFCEGY